MFNAALLPVGRPRSGPRWSRAEASRGMTQPKPIHDSRFTSRPIRFRSPNNVTEEGMMKRMVRSGSPVTVVGGEKVADEADGEWLWPLGV